MDYPLPHQTQCQLVQLANKGIVVFATHQQGRQEKLGGLGH